MKQSNKKGVVFVRKEEHKTEHTYYSRHGYEAEIKRLNKYVELEEQRNERKSSE